MELELKVKQKELDQRIEKAVIDIFKTYDRDSSGFLDKRESKKLIFEILKNLGINGDGMKDKEFD